jgi:hypothetical protein
VHHFQFVHNRCSVDHMSGEPLGSFSSGKSHTNKAPSKIFKKRGNCFTFPYFLEKNDVSLR